jgi:glycosyltransferase involved in cell wall biosynthesis
MIYPTGPQVVSVVIPCLNEEDAIGPLIAELAVEGFDEILIVDNGSTDQTASVARAAGAAVVSEPVAGYGRACARGIASVRPDCDIVCFLDGDGSDIPRFLTSVTALIAADQADFAMGSRVLGRRERGSMTVQQIVAGRLAGLLLRLVYGVRFTDMSPMRAMRLDRLRGLGMSDMTYGWNLEMQMRVAAAGLRTVEIPVDHRRRRGGVSKVSGNLAAGIKAGWKIGVTFLRLSRGLRQNRRTRLTGGGV